MLSFRSSPGTLVHRQKPHRHRAACPSVRRRLQVFYENTLLLSARCFAWYLGPLGPLTGGGAKCESAKRWDGICGLGSEGGISNRQQPPAVRTTVLCCAPCTAISAGGLSGPCFRVRCFPVGAVLDGLVGGGGGSRHPSTPRQKGPQCRGPMLLCHEGGSVCLEERAAVRGQESEGVTRSGPARRRGRRGPRLTRLTRDTVDGGCHPRMSDKARGPALHWASRGGSEREGGERMISGLNIIATSR